MAETQPGSPQQSHGQSPYAAPPPRGLSIASLIIGVASIVLGLTVLVPLVGLILGVMGLRREPEGRGFALAGIWINAVILLLGAIVVVFVIVTLLTVGVFSIPLIFENGVSYG